MVRFSYTDSLKSGVPLGGIGTGKLEINNKGKLINVTILGNFSNPIKTTRGFHIFVIPDESTSFFLEKELKVYNMQNYEIDDLIYEGVYPFIFLKGNKNGIEVNLTAFSSIIPNNIKDSNIPAVGMEIEVKGSKSGKIALSFPNIVGTSPIGRRDRRVGSGIIFENPKSIDLDPRKGEVYITGDNVSKTISQYNINVDAVEAFSSFIYKDLYEQNRVWNLLEKYESDEHEVTGFWDDPAGIIISDYKENRVRFVISWYSRGKSFQYPYGYFYHNNFSNAIEVANYFLDNFDRLKEESMKWHDIDAEPWLKDAIINSAYILSSSTILDEKGRFGIFEGPENFPVINTIAGLCYEGALPILFLFPALEKSVIREFAYAMREDGYVPHDLGLYSLDLPIDGTTSPPKWKDLNPTFILLIYRYFKFTGDKEFLRELYPFAIKALKWELKQDKDNDGVPELEGSGDSGFDVTRIKGIDSYTTSVYIASLIALREMAIILNDKENKDFINELLEKARKVYSSLFNGKYFIPWTDIEEKFVFSAQILGEWWVELLDLEKIIDEEKISFALNYILEINGKVSPYCTPNMVKENGEVVEKWTQAYSSWPRLVFAISWLGYKRNKEKWLEILKKEWDNLISKGIVWNQPSRINSRDGNPEPLDGYLDHYIGNASIWSFVKK
ncbi:GH116 family glycosyl hydrolase [Acidianus manzaensis]|uniref:Glycosyl-hydrolase family 116 catalytic region domain-containing protein n=1 Tax=Acidianus manzaensis TaxID=282676 RepID=A0A1W6JYT7_9CREN|nr:GH116 family glycosyl hydrolase [Acidianus manzaensis]ARM75436.1 hypothetical protein B6F84_04930 [Acidianus manzaensis]